MKVTRTKKNNLKIKFDNTEEKLFLWGLLNNKPSFLEEVMEVGLKNKVGTRPRTPARGLNKLWTEINNIMTEENNMYDK